MSGWLLALPWVFPFASGPSPSVQAWLFTLGAAVVLLMLLCAMPTLAADLPDVIVSAWLGAALVSAVLGLLQYFGMAQVLAPWLPGSSAGQAYGALRQRNQFATLMLIGMVAALAQVQRPGGLRRWTLPAVLLLVAGNAASTSRTGALGLALLCVAPLVWPAWRSRRVAWCLGLGLASYVVLAWAMPQLLALWRDVQVPSVFERMAGGPGCGSRLVLWSNVMHLITLKPWLGWGWGELDYAHYMTLYPGERFCDILDNAHMLPLHVAVELGVPAAVVGLAAMGVVVWLGRPWRETRPARLMAWLVLGLLALHSMVEYPLWYGPFCLALGVCLLLVVPRRVSVHGWPAAVALMALLGGIAWAGFDYWRVSQLYRSVDARHAAYRDGTLAKVRDTGLFQDQVNFAELTTTPVTPASAARQATLARGLLHYSPEPRVIQPLIESLALLGREDEALAHLVRLRAAFPQEYAQWRAATPVSLP